MFWQIFLTNFLTKFFDEFFDKFFDEAFDEFFLTYIFDEFLTKFLTKFLTNFMTNFLTSFLTSFSTNYLTKFDFLIDFFLTYNLLTIASFSIGVLLILLIIYFQEKKDWINSQLKSQFSIKMAMVQSFKSSSNFTGIHLIWSSVPICHHFQSWQWQLSHCFWMMKFILPQQLCWFWLLNFVCTPCFKAVYLTFPKLLIWRTLITGICLSQLFH